MDFIQASNESTKTLHTVHFKENHLDLTRPLICFVGTLELYMSETRHRIVIHNNQFTMLQITFSTLKTVSKVRKTEEV